MIPSLLEIVRDPGQISWMPFHEGVQIHRLYGDGVSGPCAALIRFEKGGRIPEHEHRGFEHLLILSGSQEDDNDVATEGALIINPPGTRHRVVSTTGCIALAIYERPVAFIASPGTVSDSRPGDE